MFIDIDQLNAKADKGTLSLLELIKMIQTCESRLKLEWISGKEGTSNEFQVDIVLLRN